MCEAQFDKLFKILAPDLSQGFTKNDLMEFLTYLEKCCNFKAPMLSEADMGKLVKEASISEVKNNKAQLTKFMDGLLQRLLQRQEGLLASNSKL